MKFNIVFLRRVLTIGLCIIGLAMPDVAKAVIIHGNVISSGAETTLPGIYTFDTSAEGSLTLVPGTEGILSQGGGVYADGRYVSICADTGMLTVYNAYTWQPVGSYKAQGAALDLTYVEPEGKIYGCFTDTNQPVLGILDPSTGQYAAIGVMRIPPVTLMSDASGALYCIGMDGSLYALNKTDAGMEAIGSTGIYPLSAQSAVIDTSTGKCYWAAVDDEFKSGLYEVNLSDGSVKHLYDFKSGEEITGLYILPELPNEAPGKVEALRADFAYGSNTGRISFVLPEERNDGKPLAGALRWEMDINGTVSSGQGTPGEEIDVPMTLNTGEITVMVTVINDAGAGAKSVLTAYIGCDTPVPVSNVALRKTGHRSVSLSWQPSAGGIHGGYVDMESIVYDVVRYPGNVKVASGFAGTSLTDEIDAPRLAAYYYAVTALAGGITSSEAASNRVTMGPAAGIPFADDFSSTLSFGTFMTIDANGDGVSWYQNIGSERGAYPGQNNGDADDWLITPPLSLSAGDNYRVRFDICSNSMGSQRMEIMAGNLPGISDMTLEIMPATDFSEPYQWKTVETNFHVPSDGDWYLALHALSVAGSGVLEIDNLAVESVGSTLAPQAPQALTAKAYADGATKADIGLRAPSSAINGNPLSGKCGVRLFRGEDLIYTFTDVNPGAELNYTDVNAANGFNTYRAMSFNDYGDGESVSVEVYIGIDVPGPVSSIRLEETSDGNVSVSWTAPVSGKNGGFINPSGITYKVFRNGWKNIADGITETIARDLVEESLTSQWVVAYTVIPVSSAGEGVATESYAMLVGTPYATPFNDSFKGGRPLYYGWSTFPMGQMMSWTPTVDAVFPSQDGDGGLIATSVYDDTPLGATLVSPKIMMDDTVNPVMEFYIASTPVDDNLEIAVMTDGFTRETVTTIDLSNGIPEWTKITVPLVKYVDCRAVQLALTCHSVTRDNTVYFDNFSVTDNLAVNLAVSRPEGPFSFVAGVESEVKAEVVNYGFEESGGYILRILTDDRILAEVAGESLQPGASATLPLRFVPSVADAPEITFRAEIECDNDRNPANNVSPKVTIPVDAIAYNAPTALAGRNVGNGVLLQWNRPVNDADGYVETTDDFESYPSFTVSELGDWSTVEGDPGHEYSMEFQNGDGEWIVFPGDYTWKNMSFTLVDLSRLPTAHASDGWEAVSGNKFLMTPYSSTSAESGSAYVGDYLISPKLKECEQTVTLHAKSLNYGTWGLEKMEILISSTDADISSFRVLETVDEVPESWTRYTFVLPEGTRYFAVYSCQTVTALFLDDISYIAENAVEAVPELKGYNIYRGQLRLNDEPVMMEQFLDTAVEEGASYSYAVSAVYGKGESALSEAVTVDLSGIAGVSADQVVRVKTSCGQIEVSGCDGMKVVVCTVDGRTVASADGKDRLTFNLLPGMYIVTVQNQSFKTIVR